MQSLRTAGQQEDAAEAYSSNSADAAVVATPNSHRNAAVHPVEHDHDSAMSSIRSVCNLGTDTDGRISVPIK